MRASIVCEPTLALCTKEMDLGKYLYLGKGEDMTGGRSRKSILSDALEAVIGAIYLDGGFASAKEFILRFILTDIEHKQLFYDSKTILQEIVQASHKEELGYRLVKRKDRTTTNTLWQRHMSATGSSDRAKAGPKRAEQEARTAEY